MKSSYLGGRTSGGFNVLLSILYTTGIFLMYTFFLKWGGSEGSEARKQQAYYPISGNPSRQFSRNRSCKINHPLEPTLLLPGMPPKERLFILL